MVEGAETMMSTMKNNHHFYTQGTSTKQWGVELLLLKEQRFLKVYL